MDKKDTKIKGSEETIAKYFKYGVIALVALLVIAVGLIVYFNYSGSYVATVGSEKVSVSEYNFFLKQSKDAMLNEAQAADPNIDPNTFWNTKINGENALELAKKKALDSARELKIQVIKAKDQKIALEKQDNENIENSIKSIITQSGNDKKQADATFKAQYGISLDEFKEIYKEFILREKLYQKESEAMKLSDEDIKKVYDEDSKSFDKVTVRHILFSYTGKDGKRTQDESKKLAEDMLVKVKAGEDMKALAKQHSEDPGVTENEGEYVFTKFDNYVDEFKDWALKASVGDAGIVETTFGYHVMKLEKREPTPFDNVKEQIKAGLVDKKYAELLEQWKKDPKFNAVKNQRVYDSIS